MSGLAQDLSAKKENDPHREMRVVPSVCSKCSLVQGRNRADQFRRRRRARPAIPTRAKTDGAGTMPTKSCMFPVLL